MTVNDDRLMDLLGRFVGDLGATMAAGSIVIGDQLGLYRALAEGPATADELAARTGTATRYLQEWLNGQAAGGYVEYDATTGHFSLTDEQAFALTDPDGPLYLPGAFQFALGTLRATDDIARAFQSGEGFGWHEHDEDVFIGCERFFRPGYVANLATSWIPALDGVQAKLAAGAQVADIGCGLGASSVLMAITWPASTIRGSDYHDGSIEQARARAEAAGVSDRVQFEVARAQDFGGGPYDLVTSFDSLHDMGDPLAAGRNVHGQLHPDGTWMIVEPFAGDDLSANLNPVGRIYYSGSTMLCVPNALSQPGGYALGAQAGEQPIRQICVDAGFSRFDRVAETPFNIVYEARP